MGKLKNYNDETLLDLSFSTDEKFTGLFWLDGKKIYQKGYKGTLPSSQATLDKIEGIENLLGAIGIAGPMNSWYINPNSYFTAGYRWTVAKYGTSIYLNVEDYSAGKPYQLVIFYTKAN